MSDIFVSYSSKDRDFALQLVDDLEQFYEVWIDRDDLAGGLEWEQKIDGALRDCGVFVVIVSSDSNASEWVARETIRAEQLKKFRIPILLNDQLPLRLLNLHFVDFQGEYEGGFRDLLEALQEHIAPEDRQQLEANRLIGKGVRAYLSRDYPTANSLVGQALILDASISETVSSFWKQLQHTQTTDWANDLMPRIVIGERAKQLDTDKYLWLIELNNKADILDKIDYVQYRLHETFPKPIQTVRARDKNFQLYGQGWGTFDIGVTIHFKDGSIGMGEYPLHFTNRESTLNLS